LNSIIEPSDISDGNHFLLTLFLGRLFSVAHGLPLEEAGSLTVLPKMKSEVSATTKAMDEAEKLKMEQEEDLFRQTINSWKVKDVHLRNIFEDCRDGVILSKVIDSIKSNAVDWSKIKANPRSDFELNINNNSMIQGCKDLGLSIIGIAGTDFTKGKEKEMLTVTWQIVRLYSLRKVGSEAQLLEWVNNSIKHKSSGIKKFNDT
jgi:hypothetical protein